MAIKKVVFSFAVPIEELLALMSTGRTDMRVDVLGTDPAKASKRLNGAAAPKLLEPPRNAARATDSNGRKTSGRELVRDYFLKHHDRAVTTKEIKPILIAAGLKGGSVSPQLDVMLKKHQLKRTAAGTYQLTAKGIRDLKNEVSAHGS